MELSKIHPLSDDLTKWFQNFRKIYIRSAMKLFKGFLEMNPSTWIFWKFWTITVGIFWKSFYDFQVFLTNLEIVENTPIKIKVKNEVTRAQ